MDRGKGAGMKDYQPPELHSQGSGLVSARGHSEHLESAFLGLAVKSSQMDLRFDALLGVHIWGGARPGL